MVAVSTERQAAYAGDGDGRSRPRLVIVGPLPPPFIGPAVATERLINSTILQDVFDLVFVDTSDRDGLDSIGALSWSNVVTAIRHGFAFVRSLRMRPDVVYIPIARGLWGFLRDLLFILPARLRGCACVVHLRAGRFDLIHDYGWIGRLIARVGLGSVDRALVLGDRVRSVFGDIVRSENIGVVSNGLCQQLWPIPDRSHEPERSAPLRIAYLANLFADKGAHVLLQAIPTLRARGIAVSCAFAGEWQNESYRQQCMGYVVDHGIEEYVRFLGRVDDKQKKALFADSDLAVFVPIAPEGQPWVVLEAMACGLPVIGTPQGTIPDMVANGLTGAIVPAGDSDGLAEAIGALAGNRNALQVMGVAARARFEALYTEEHSHRLLARILLEAASRRR